MTFLPQGNFTSSVEISTHSNHHNGAHFQERLRSGPEYHDRTGHCRCDWSPQHSSRIWTSTAYEINEAVIVTGFTHNFISNQVIDEIGCGERNLYSDNASGTVKATHSDAVSMPVERRRASDMSSGRRSGRLIAPLQIGPRLEALLAKVEKGAEGLYSSCGIKDPLGCWWVCQQHPQ